MIYHWNFALCVCSLVACMAVGHPICFEEVGLVCSARTLLFDLKRPPPEMYSHSDVEGSNARQKSRMYRGASTCGVRSFR